MRRKVRLIKKFAALLLILSFILALCPAAFAVSVSDFFDVRSTDWFYNAVDFVTKNGMFNGTGASAFSPNGTMTRGMFVTVLGRYGGAPTVEPGSKIGTVTKSDVNLRTEPSTQNTGVLLTLQNGASVEVLGEKADLTDPAYIWYYVRYKGTLGYIRTDLMTVSDSGFADVSADAYYYSYVQWAVTAGIAAATGDGSFSPERAITREEICSMLANYASYKNYQLKAAVSAKSFTDGAAVSAAYAAAVTKLQQAAVIDGYTDGSFKPQGSATRAEVSTMLMRFIDAISYKKAAELSYDAAGNYIFGTETPQTAAVSADYFSDACFIGHSLVNGMKTYLGLSNADFFAKNGASARYFLTYNDLELTTTHLDDRGYTVRDEGTLAQAMSDKSYGKVYIMLGINEIGASAAASQNFYTSMDAIIKLVRQTQPNAKIYLISLTPVSQACSETSVYNRDSILAFNAVLKQLGREQSAYYLNVFDLLCNANGFMDAGFVMSDGIHLLAPAYASIKNYLMTRTV
jgi:lysophospholipase L1-like esterase